MDESAIKVEHLYKDFRLPHERRDSLKERLLNFRRRQSFEKLHALKDLSFEVKRGEFFGIVGRNGSGKSTLLKTLGGIYQPTKGRATIHGTLTPFIELGIGFNPELTGRENVFLNGAILGLTTKEIRRIYDEIVDFAELHKFMDQKLKNYSSGMQVRLAFSIAIRAHNDILLIDEVLAVGDASFQRKCFETFKGIKQSQKTVIFVSHDMNAIREYCDRAILIEGGHITSSGIPDKVANDYIELFNRVGGDSGPKTEGRWGDQRATIGDVKVEVDQQQIEVSYEVTAKAAIDNPIFGVIIKDLDNNHLFDSNTKWKKLKTGSFAKGQKIRASWRLPNVLKSGRYRLTVAAAHEDGYGFYDWQDEVKTFDINRPEQTAGVVLLDDTITLKRVQ